MMDKQVEHTEAEIKKRLDEELDGLHYTSADLFLQSALRRNSWKQRVNAWWNTEIELPLIPVAAVCILLIGALLLTRDKTAPEQPLAVDEPRQLIEVGGNTYWKDDYERAVASIADSH
ncbi:hypothetical protein ACFFSY_23325 [Paenibacillus aurantiacus]|uniref:DUF3619 family protein n=1 Tax=Paenibacillus aurantiacus TaxID=1936118 RepID=A0ABV5KUG5_9BACL